MTIGKTVLTRVLTTGAGMLAMILVAAVYGAAAERKWQSGTWGDITTSRRMVDFGPGASGFGRPGAAPAMRAMADVRRLIIETDDLRLEMEDTVSVGRRSFDAIAGARVTFAIEKNSVYIRGEGRTEHKIRLLKRTERSREPAPDKK
jgi:hypothetical protein